MNQFTPIDLERWPRAAQYRLFTRQWTTISYTVTQKLDAARTVTWCRARHQKFVPALLWAVTRSLLEQENFRLAVRDDVLGSWDVIHPIYPVVTDAGNLLFCSTPYTPDYGAFYEGYRLQQQALRRADNEVFAGPMPENGYILSVVPYMDFSSVSFHLKNAKNYYAPVLDIGRYTPQGDRLMMPVSLTINHAAADLHHVHRMLTALQALLDSPETWCRVPGAGKEMHP